MEAMSKYYEMLAKKTSLWYFPVFCNKISRFSIELAACQGACCAEVSGTIFNSSLKSPPGRCQGTSGIKLKMSPILISMDWFKGNLQESPIFNGKIYGFL